MTNYQQTVEKKLPEILEALSQGGVKIPDYVLAKTASYTDTDNLPDIAFANPAERTFPIKTKSDTWISAAIAATEPHDLVKNASTRERIKRMISKGAEFWNIRKDDLARMDAILAPCLEKTASSGKSFTDYITEALEKMDSTTELQQRTLLSQALLKKADELNHSLSATNRLRLEQSACMGTCDRDIAIEWLENLQDKLPKKATDAVTIIDTCLDTLRESPRYPANDALQKIAGLVDFVIHTRPQGQLPSELPEKHIFSMPPCLIKFAKEQIVDLPCGKVWRDELHKHAGEIAGNIYALTGKLCTELAEIEQALEKMTPAIASNIING